MITHFSKHRASGTDSSTHYGWLPITLILVAATAIFVYRLGHEGLWVDEFFSLRDATRYRNNFFDGLYATRLRPLYYMILAGWMQFGSSDAWLRIPSLVASVISVFLIYRLGKRISNHSTGLVAAALLTTSPLFVNHAQEVRMYALSVCLCLAGSLFAADILLTERGQKPQQHSFIGWTVFRLLAIYTVPLNLTLLIPDAFLMAFKFRRDRTTLINCAKWMLLILLLWSPIILTALSEVSSDSTYAQTREKLTNRPGLNNLVYPLKYWMVPPFVTNQGKAAHLFYKLFTLPIAGLVGAGLIHKRKSASLPWAAAWFVLPLIPIVVCSLFAAQLWAPRYVLFVSPYLFILIAAGLTRLWKDWKPAAILLALIYTIGIGNSLIHYYNVQNRADYKYNLATIQQEERAGDAVVWGHSWDTSLGRSALSHYYTGTSDFYFSSSRDIERGDSDGVKAWIAQFPSERERIWVVVDDFRRVQKDFETIVSDTYNIEDSFEDYERHSAIFLLTPIGDES